MKDNEKLVEVLGKLSGQLEELSEIIDPSVTVYRTVDKGSKAAEALAWFEGAAALAKPKWRAMVDEQSTFAKPPLSTVLYNMYLCTEDHFLLNSLARIVAVCERQVPGWKAKPYESNDFSTFQLVSAFGSVLRNPAEPALRDWQALGEEAASWLKHLTEADNE